jgi:hypothetical protein
MKKAIRYALMFLATTSLFYSCAPDDGDPQNGDSRDKFVGSWICSENSHQMGTSSFTVTISLNPANTYQILLANFYQLGASQKVVATVAGSSVTVASQQVSGVSVRGSGSITNNDTKINWNYYVDDGADIDTCSAVFTK